MAAVGQPRANVKQVWTPDVGLKEANLSGKQEGEVTVLLQRYNDVFSKSSGDIGRTNVLQHRIDTGNEEPVKQPLRRIPGALKEEVHEQIDNMLKNDVIEPSSSPWSSPIVLVRKKDGSVRFCVDYRRLNSLTRKDAHPLPRVDDCLDALSGSRWFSTMDCSSGYWQVEMDKDDKEKTAFAATSNLYHFKVMSFGLTNAPGTFQRLMELVLKGLDWRSILVYLDDILIFTPTFEEHLEVLEEVFRCLRKAGLKLKPSKCFLLRNSVTFLGHKVSSEGVSPDPANVEKVRDYPRPTTVVEVRSFLGLASYYRRFVADFAKIASPLQDLTQKDARFQWSEQCETAFLQLRHALVSAPVLGYPNFKSPYQLYTDASQHAVGAVLSQFQGGKEKVIAYASKTLTKTEKKWSTFDKEFWAIVWSVRHFRPYLCGSTFVIYTDHKPLVNVRNMKAGSDPTGRMERWLIELGLYDFTVNHREGKLHTNADAMYRIPEKEEGDKVSADCDVVVCDRYVHEGHWLCSLSVLKERQLQDDDLSVVMQSLRSSEQRPPLPVGASPELRSLWSQWNRLELKQGVLHRRWEDNEGKRSWLQAVIPRNCREEVLRGVHDHPTGGHLGLDKTLSKLRLRYYWFGMSKDAEVWCSKCLTCATGKSPSPKTRAPLVTDVPSYPMERIGIDVVGPLPTTDKGNRFIVVVSDYFTKWPEAFATPNHQSMTIAEILVNEVFCRWGVPTKIQYEGS